MKFISFYPIREVRWLQIGHHIIIKDSEQHHLHKIEIITNTHISFQNRHTGIKEHVMVIPDEYQNRTKIQIQVQSSMVKYSESCNLKKLK